MCAFGVVLAGRPPKDDRDDRRRGEAPPETVRRPNEVVLERSDDDAETERKLAREEVDDCEALTDLELIQ